MRHTALGMCRPSCHPIPKLSFDSFICDWDYRIVCIIEICEEGNVCELALEKQYSHKVLCHRNFSTKPVFSQHLHFEPS